MTRQVVFCFDICCPFAYLASQRMGQLSAALKKAAKTAPGGEVDIVWKPVLLGGLYELTNAPQGKDGSATDKKAMPAENKRLLMSRDLQREAERWKVTLNWNSKHPIRTLDAQRLLCGISDPVKRVEAALHLYKAYWVDGLDVSEKSVLQDVGKKINIRDVSELITSQKSKDTLTENTKWAVSKGVFGVPSFICQNNGEESLFFGQDRSFFVALFMGVPRHEPLAHPLRLRPIEKKGTNKCVKMVFYHDFSSPWSFLGSLQVESLCKAHGISLVYRPILLGALFRDIGTPNAPMLTLTPIKREFGAKDMKEWCRFHGNIQLRFPDGFPIRTVLPLRISIVEPRTINMFYHAAWIKGINIGDEEEVRKLLAENGFDAEELIEKAGKAKGILKENTEEAKSIGACGVPTFQIRGANGTQSELVWGQDRLNVVSDMIADMVAEEKTAMMKTAKM